MGSGVFGGGGGVGTLFALGKKACRHHWLLCVFLSLCCVFASFGASFTGWSHTGKSRRGVNANWCFDNERVCPPPPPNNHICSGRPCTTVDFVSIFFLRAIEHTRVCSRSLLSHISAVGPSPSLLSDLFPPPVSVTPGCTKG